MTAQTIEIPVKGMDCASCVKHVQEAMKRPDAIEAAKKFGYQIVAGNPEQMTARLHADIDGVKELVAKAGIKAEN